MFRNTQRDKQITCRGQGAGSCDGCCDELSHGRTANLRTSTKILDFRGFGPSRILISRGGIPRPTGNSRETLSQGILVGMILVGRLGVRWCIMCHTQVLVHWLGMPIIYIYIYTYVYTYVHIYIYIYIYIYTHTHITNSCTQVFASPSRCPCPSLRPSSSHPIIIT